MKKVDERFKILEPIDEAIANKRKQYNHFIHSKNVWGAGGEWHIKTKSKKVEEKFHQLKWEIRSLCETRDVLIKHIKSN